MIEVKQELNQTDGCIEVTCGITNGSKSTLDLESVLVAGPVRDVRQRLDGRVRDKPAFFGPTKTPVNLSIPPGAHGKFLVLIYPDREAVARTAESLASKTRRTVSSMLWRAFGWSSPSGAIFSIRVIARNRSSRTRPKVFTAIASISVENAQQMVARSKLSS